MKKSYVMITLLAITIVATTNVYFSYQTSHIIDSLTQGHFSSFYQNIGLMFFAFVCLLVAELIRQICNQRFLNQVSYRIHQNVIGRLLTKEGLLKRSEASQYLSNVTNDIEMVKDLYYDTFFSLYQGIVSFVIASLALVSLDKKIAAVILLVSLLPVVIPYIFKGIRSHIQENLSREKARYQTDLNDLLSSLVIVKNIGLYREFSETMTNQYRRINQEENRQATWKAIVNVLSAVPFYLTFVLILYLGGRAVFAGQLSLGSLVAIYTISLELSMPILLVAGAVSDMTSVGSIRKNLMEFSMLPVVPRSPKLFDFRDIELRSVVYQIEDKRIFSNLTLKFEAGKKYLIQGESGVGKSILAYLVTQNTEEQVRGIYINGIETAQLSYQTVQSYMSFLPQKVSLFHTSIWHNLTLDRPVSEASVLEWLERFGLSDRFPSRVAMEHEIVDADSSLSGGQQQRLALIRSLLLEKAVLILDETLSGLDDATFSTVERALLEQENITLLHISHRTYHAQDYDQQIIL
ncbi:ATP-binding cassette domain-containing protein [Streptococcus sp. zg-86]|uniref:ATP-binding cassette domain-containing protein n=1 Tax=Streptococcus zhangguiae TaxID=2664091 RepID=A0A6I4RGY4_9STRE|nr:MULTISPECIES: ABC transporter ATP-binding protein [unclassified Streptococcus]MTB63712.1 ATP-binding cassette domain-containing protein [Streptococcus sp. zg-86]MTB90022.1 ATP-binding cassette domain-containing protein [Streptococcus sp. zg-36]MWV55693.1 ATP-binding cassette domain-containing protein [Streptococcus sp. zg-70]QTH48015.1 ABC transporter ATP-binding protein [Streptococcus sp. zg-86]